MLIASIDIATCYILWEWHVEVWSLMQGSRHFFGLKGGAAMAAPATPMPPALLERTEENYSQPQINAKPHLRSTAVVAIFRASMLIFYF